MKKHRKKTHHRKIVVAVGALALVAVPTTAMACLDPQETGPVRPAASQQDSRPWHGGPLGDPGAQPPAEAPFQADAPAEPAGQPVAEAPAEPVADTAPPVQPEPQQPVEPPAEPAGTPAPSDSAAPSGAVAEVLALVNQERATVGCPALTVNEKLTKAAQDHSEDMAAHSNMSHTGSDGSDPGQRITRAGYQWSTYAENVAYGYDTAAKVMEGWMNSPGHKRNILDCNVKEIGIGLAQPGQYWTQDFGATR
ncbi:MULTISPECIES: CAP domain-containing protein [unclassified Streptomyces]|uniref:CAP domain-containing protein n=1 Tax=unclassified Streptomyces TaxID=2593676 RepID=UPI000DC7CFA1|nr:MULTISPECIES: CAP domain-containing protein [unclassified Streptomyces]AWZ08855.1 CAP domain-containing protein [Streptomyces sp. ICC4]AWZ15770.1 CAP domain-containing protein [Streptomyces sp. ICC1]